MRRLGVRTRPDAEGAGLGMLLVLLALSVVVWAVNPFTVLLLLPAVHLWLLIVSPDTRPRPPATLALVLVAFLPLLALVGFYAHLLGLGPSGAVWEGLLLIAGGHVSLGGAVLWSVALGSASAAAMLSSRRRPR